MFGRSRRGAIALFSLLLATAPAACGSRSALLPDELSDAPASFGGGSPTGGTGGGRSGGRAGSGPGAAGASGLPTSGGVTATGGAVATGGMPDAPLCAGKACVAPLICHEKRCVDPSLYLGALSVTDDAGDLIQFDRERVRYAAIAEADVDSVTIRAVVESPDAVVTIDGERGGALVVELGEELRRTIEVVVENPLGQTRVHEVLLIREGIEDYVRPASPVSYSELGAAVALSGDTLAVGAPGPVSGDPPPDVARPTGYVVIFRYSDAEWVEEARLEAEVPVVGDGFGSPIALDGDTLVVGAPRTLPVGDAGNTQGAAYIFERVGSTWSLSASLSPSAISDYELGLGNFGDSVAVYGDNVAIGIPGSLPAGPLTSGAVAVYSKEGSAWTPSFALPEKGDGGFGTSVALGVNGAGVSRLAVGAGTARSVHLFDESNGAWQPTATLESPNLQADNFGWNLALSGDTLVVSAEFEGSEGSGVNPERTDDPFDGTSYSGAVYVYRETPEAWVEEAHIKSPAPDGYGYFGWAVALHHDTLVVGARQEAGPGRGPTAQAPDLEPPPASSEQYATGSVTVLQRRQGVWHEEVYLKTPGQLGTFGAAVAVSDGFIAIGSQVDSRATDSDTGLPYSGGVFVWPWNAD